MSDIDLMSIPIKWMNANKVTQKTQYSVLVRARYSLWEWHVRSAADAMWLVQLNAGTRCSLLFILFPYATSATLYRDWMVSMHMRMKPRSFSESTGLERNKAGHEHPQSLSCSIMCYVSCFQGNSKKYFGQLKSKGCDKARERRQRGKIPNRRVD